MNMQSAVKCVLGNYATFSGRAPRSEFWWFALAMWILMIALAVIEGGVVAPMLGFESFAPEAGQPLSLIASLALLIPSIAVGVRRLHDIGRSGWWLLINFIPLIGFLVLLYWLVQPSSEGSNQFG